MSARIIDVEYVLADLLYPDQLEVGDIIQEPFEDEFVKITNIETLENGYEITYSNDFGEIDSIIFDEYQQVSLFVIR